MSWEAFRDLGWVEGALGKSADIILAKYTEEEQYKLRHLFLRLVQPGEGATDTRRRAFLDDLVPAGTSPNAVNNLLGPWVDKRLLTKDIDQATGKETVELSHEALIRAWPTFTQWINDAREDLYLQLRLEEAAKEWQNNDQNPDYLWRGLPLARVNEWYARAQPTLPKRDERFLNASRAQEQARKEEEQARLKAKEERTRKLSQQNKYLKIGIVIMSLLVLSFFVMYVSTLASGLQ